MEYNLEDTKSVIKSGKSKKDQHNTTGKTKDWAPNTCAPGGEGEGGAVHAPLMVTPWDEHL